MVQYLVATNTTTTSQKQEWYCTGNNSNDIIATLSILWWKIQLLVLSEVGCKKIQTCLIFQDWSIRYQKSAVDVTHPTCPCPASIMAPPALDVGIPNPLTCWKSCCRSWPWKFLEPWAWVTSNNPENEYVAYPKKKTVIGKLVGAYKGLGQYQQMPTMLCSLLATHYTLKMSLFQPRVSLLSEA